MQDLGTEVGQLGSLFKVQLVHGLRLVHHSGIVVVHAVDVGPYLYFLGIDGGTDERGRVVAAAALQVVNLSVGIAADESLGDVHLVLALFLQNGRQLVLDVDGVWLGILVGAHEVERVQQHHVDALLLHVVRHEVGRDHLALCHDALLLKAREQFFGEGAQVLKFVMKEFVRHLLVLLRVVEFLNVAQVLLFQSVDHLVGAVGVLLVEIV